MTVLVTGSSGHLGEALMRTLRASGRAAIGLDVIPGPFTDEVGSIADRAWSPAHERRRRGPPCRDAAQAACRDASAGGVRRDERSRHADPARGGGARWRPRLRHDLDDQRLRRRAEAPAGRAGGLDRRARRAVAEEHLWRHQDRGRGPLPIVPSQRGPGGDCAQDLALLSRGGRRSGGARCLRRR